MKMDIVQRRKQHILSGAFCISAGSEPGSAHIDGVRTGIHGCLQAFKGTCRRQHFNLLFSHIFFVFHHSVLPHHSELL